MTRFPGSESGPCFAALRFPWPLPFPPRPPRPVARVCSAASLVLWAGLTSLDRASADYGRSLAAAARRNRARQSRDLQVSVWMVSRRAWSLGPRGAGVHLAMTVRAVLPSAFLYSVGTPEISHFASSGASSVRRRTRLTYVACMPFARAMSSKIAYTPVSSIVRHRNAGASAFTIALSTRGRGSRSAPSGVTTRCRPPRSGTTQSALGASKQLLPGEHTRQVSPDPDRCDGGRRACTPTLRGFKLVSPDRRLADAAGPHRVARQRRP